MELNDKLLEKAKNAKTVEELVAVAKENGFELTAEEAKTYFAKLNAKEGELADDELDNVAGGGKCGTMYCGNRPVVTICNSCEYYTNEKTGKKEDGNGMCGTCASSKDVGMALLCYRPERYDN